MHKHGTKTTPVFLPVDGEASWLQLPSLVSLLSGATVQLENTYSSIRNVTSHQRTIVHKYKLHKKPVMKHTNRYTFSLASYIAIEIYFSFSCRVKFPHQTPIIFLSFTIEL